MKKPFALIIRDGWGYNANTDYNAVFKAKTPNHDYYCASYPTNFISTSGLDVGLPEGNQGSSEVGHLNMGAGRVVYQSLVRINNSIKDGSFFKNDVFLDAIKHAKENNSKIHIMGLVQDQGVHGHTDHLLALLELAKNNEVSEEQVMIHIFSDGRDTPPKSTKKYIQPVINKIEELKIGKIATICGRYYAMDRDNRWERVKLAYDMLTFAKSERPFFENVFDAVDDAYNEGETDEFIKPRILKGYDGIKDSDVIIFFNYRLDRTREITKAFVEDGFDKFETKDIKNLYYVCMTEYYDGVDKNNRAIVKIAFPPITLKNLFGEVVSKAGLKQLRIAETEKYAHVTFFFNGQSDQVFENEDRVLIPSPKVPTYDMKPEMSAYEVRDKVLELLDKDKYDFIVLNFANPDMVGHTGVFEAAVKANEVVDECVGNVIDKILEKDGIVFLTSDHGNSEQMKDYETGKPHTAHTTNPVWLHIISKRPELQKDKIKIKDGGKLADIAPTMLKLMNIEIPPEMDGNNLIEEK